MSMSAYLHTTVISFILKCYILTSIPTVCEHILFYFIIYCLFAVLIVILLCCNTYFCKLAYFIKAHADSEPLDLLVGAVAHTEA